MKYLIKKWYWNICDFINPKQNWLIKKIPNRWIDNDVLLELCVLEIIKGFVEVERGLKDYKSSQNDDYYPESQKRKDRELKEIYTLITEDLVKLEHELESKYSIGVEKQIYDLKTKIMIWAVNNRDYLWT